MVFIFLDLLYIGCIIGVCVLSLTPPPPPSIEVMLLVTLLMTYMSFLPSESCYMYIIELSNTIVTVCHGAMMPRYHAAMVPRCLCYVTDITVINFIQVPGYFIVNNINY